MAQEALGYQSLLVRYIRQGGLVETQDNDGDSWVHWAQAESVRRAKLCGFSFLSMLRAILILQRHSCSTEALIHVIFWSDILVGLQSIAFGSLPVLLGRDIGLRLPTSCAEWLASGQEVWISERQRALELTPMPLALRRLLQQQPADVCEDALPLTSPFGNYILIHALHQQIYYARQLGGPFGSAAVDERMIEDLESALDLWKCGWEKAPESVLNLKNSRDSLSFAATALLGLAHVRLHFDLGAHAALQTCDPEAIASAALQAPLPELGDGLKHALLHAVHAINVPVQLGLENMARSQMFYWSVTHAVCDLECAIFLSKWLRALSIRIGERLLTCMDFPCH